MSKNPKLYYTAGELADLFELPKQTLLYYDKMGVLSPEFISENNYRHYSLKQYLILEVILNMRKREYLYLKSRNIWKNAALTACRLSYKLKTVNVKKLLHITKKYAKIFTLFFSSWIKSAKAGLIR